jgi:hypothetical protein
MFEKCIGWYLQDMFMKLAYSCVYTTRNSFVITVLLAIAGWMWIDVFKVRLYSLRRIYTSVSDVNSFAIC